MLNAALSRCRHPRDVFSGAAIAYLRAESVQVSARYLRDKRATFPTQEKYIMKRYTLPAVVFSMIAVLFGQTDIAKKSPDKSPIALQAICIQAHSRDSFNCRDAGGVPSTCAEAKCPEPYILTGGGGSCSAGDRKLKSVMPNWVRSTYVVMCEQQGVAPTAAAICCRIPR